MSSRASGFPSSFGNGQFDGEMSPEELFNMFFGGNGVNTFRSDFGAGPSMSTFRKLYQLKSLILFGQPFSLLVREEASVLNHLDRVREQLMSMSMRNRVPSLCNFFLYLSYLASLCSPPCLVYLRRRLCPILDLHIPRPKNILRKWKREDSVCIIM